MFVQFAAAAQIVGITEHQLKEWCMRRSLIAPDIQPRGRGHNALFGWRALLALRLLSAIHSRFGGTVAHWGPILERFRCSIEAKSFPALFGYMAIFDGNTVQLQQSVERGQSEILIIRLDEHLLAISRGLASNDQEIQLSLLPPLLVTR